MTWMRDDAGLRAKVDAWNERLAPLLAAVPERRPPQRVWTRSSEAPGFSALRADRYAPAPWWERLGFWRGLTAAFAVITVISAGIALRSGTPPITEVRFVEVAPTGSRRSSTRRTATSSRRSCRRARARSCSRSRPTWWCRAVTICNCG